MSPGFAGGGRPVVSPSVARDCTVKKTQLSMLKLSATPIVLGVALIAAPAYAQDLPADEADEAGAIVVTGSRIARPDLEQASPVTVVSSEEFSLQAGAANVENILNDLPSVTATQTSTSNNPGGGTATVNLRGLGAARTLVLVDGRRYVSFDVNQIVDLNTIPSALIERVDVVTGGRSAVYGSDAIAGVVNFILKRDFSGVEIGSSYGLTQKGDGQIWDVNATIGANFDDGRGNVTLHAGYVKRRPTFAGERDFSRNALTDDQSGGPLIAAGGSPSTPKGRFNIAGLGAATGTVAGGDCTNANNQVFNTDGSLKCFTGADGYNFAPINYLQVPQERFLVSAMAQYEISEAFVPYMEAQFINNRVSSQLAATPIGNSTPFGDGSLGALNIQVNSPFLAPSTQAAFAALDTDGDGYISAPSFGFRTVGLGPRINKDERNAFRVLAGLKGSIGSSWSYDGYYMYARTKNSQRQEGNIAIDRFKFATETAFVGGQLVCRNASARDAGCVPANIFGEGNLSQDAINYLAIGATNLEEYTTQVASFAITNSELFDLGAGGIGVALGAEWRSENGSVTPDSFLASGNVAGFNPGLPTSGGYSVREFFAEVNVPLISDSFIHRLEVNGAARYSHYSNAPGNVFTWSAGGLLSPVEDITFRGQYQKAVRGPSVAELFLGNTVSFEGLIEGCDVAAAATPGPLRDICVGQGVPVARLGDPTLNDPNSINPPTFIGGNPNLVEEEARTWTIGAVFAPTFLPGFTATVDYFNINLKGSIDLVGTENIGEACFERLLTNYCDAITRNALGEVERIDDLLLNTGGRKLRGIDFSAGYKIDLDSLDDGASLSFNFTGTRLIKDDRSPIEGIDLVNHCAGRFGANCTVPSPKWRSSLRTTFNLEKFSASLQWRYFGSARDDDPTTTYALERAKAQNYFDLTGVFYVSDNFKLDLGVSNLFDKKPPLSASGQNGGNGEQSNTYPTVYDVLGRSFFISGRLTF